MTFLGLIGFIGLVGLNGFIGFAGPRGFIGFSRFRVCRVETAIKASPKITKIMVIPSFVMIVDMKVM